MSSDFSLKSEIINNCLIITTSGYINNTGGESIVAEFDKNPHNSIHKVILNLSDSKVVNSIGVSYLIDVIEKLNDTGGKLIFTNLNQAVEKTFSIMGLFNFAGKAESVDEALKIFN